ncbi:transposase [Psychrobacillus sp. FJAT-51614]|uniref:Transposase n=1 Tax=Psychrobacillus mangrovi TaxID=3117745 RepID=A0ABU8F8Y0_9BACI
MNEKQPSGLEKPTHPLQEVQAVFAKLDLFVEDDKERRPLGRPWITSIVDVYTGYPLGFYTGFEAPSYTSVMNALNHAIFPKTYLKDRYPEIKNNWVAYGIPEMLLVDRGNEFAGDHLFNACEQLGIDLFVCPAKDTYFQGAIERHFRTINQSLLHKTFWSSASLSAFEESEFNCSTVSYSTLLECIHVWMVDLYPICFNKSVGGVPVKLWKESRVVPSSVASKTALMKTGNGRITGMGIRFKQLYYQSEKLVEFLHEYTAKGRKNSLEIKYDPTDISKIFVYDPLANSYFEVLCLNEEYSEGLNEHTHKAILDKFEEEKIDIEAIRAVRFKVEQLIARVEKLLLKERKKAEGAWRKGELK